MTEKSQDKKLEIIPIEIVPNTMGLITDDFQVVEASVTKGILKIQITHSGGCEEHKFQLFTDRKYMKSLPPKLKIFLQHDANQDGCKKEIVKTLYFDVSSIAYTGTEKLILDLNNCQQGIDYIINE